jgi:LytS/YehU family sensor histidine kinase
MARLFRYKLDHILFWAFTVGFHAYTSAGLVDAYDLDIFLLEVLIRNTLLATLIYLNLYFTPKYFERKQSIAAVLILLGSLAFYSLFKNIFNSAAYGRDPYELSALFYNFSIASFYLGFCFALHFTKQWYLQRELLRQVELEKLNTELEYLKSQINPHFLFNSINTIYFQIAKDNTLARDTLSRFSEMLRYQLYECSGAEIPIEKEISYLSNYVELQRMRKDENYSISFNHPDTLTHFTIPPLLLIPFIENAFKHVSHFTTESNRITIDLHVDNDTFHLRVFNTKDSYGTPNQNGIGLKNVSRRLELLYPGNHSLEVSDSADQFEVNVRFKINNNTSATL